MITNVEIEKGGNENNLSVLRRFRHRMKSSGVLGKARRNRFWSRSQSKFVQKKSKLKAIAKRKEKERLYKLGKISEL